MQREVLSGENEPRKRREEDRVCSGEVSPCLPCSHTLCGLPVGHISPYPCFAGGEIQPARFRLETTPQLDLELCGSASRREQFALSHGRSRALLAVLQTGLNPPLVVVSALFCAEQYSDLCSWQAALSNALACLSRQKLSQLYLHQSELNNTRDEHRSCGFSRCCIWQHCSMQTWLTVSTDSSSYFVSCKG